MNTAFTIVAKNYIGLAKILMESFLEKNAGSEFYIFVADDYEADSACIINSKNVLNISVQSWTEMAFKYNLTEFCTAIKPLCFEYLSMKGYDKMIYLDPDCYVFDEFRYIYDLLEKHSYVVTPHITKPEFCERTNIPDKVFLQSGIFNLGFLAIKANELTNEMISWWKNHLLYACFDDVLFYTFTDQKWMNFLPSFYSNEELYSSQHLGLNVAPWNYSERYIYQKDNVFYVQYRTLRSGIENETYKLIFAHFSGFDYKGMANGVVSRNRRSIYDYHEDNVLLLDYYSKIIKSKSETFLKYIDLQYEYATYANGDKIDTFHRRLYRKLLDNEVMIENPFSTKEWFYNRILKMGMITNNSMDKITPSNVSNVDLKLKIFTKLMRGVYKMIGYKKYLHLLKLLKHFSRYESQVFLLDNKMSEKIL